MSTFNDSTREVNSPHRDVPPGAPEQGPVVDGLPAPAGAPAAARGDLSMHDGLPTCEWCGDGYGLFFGEICELCRRVGEV